MVLFGGDQSSLICLAIGSLTSSWKMVHKLKEPEYSALKQFYYGILLFNGLLNRVLGRRAILWTLRIITGQVFCTKSTETKLPKIHYQPFLYKNVKNCSRGKTWKRRFHSKLSCSCHDHCHGVLPWEQKWSSALNTSQAKRKWTAGEQGRFHGVKNDKEVSGIKQGSD